MHDAGVIMVPNKRFAFIAIIPIAGVCMGSPQVNAQSAPPVVEKVRVDVNFRTPVPEPLRHRIVDSVGNVGEKALQGKTIEEAESLKTSLSQVMKKIFTEVLSGFKVHDLSVQIGPPAVIFIDLEAEQPQIDSVRLEVVPQSGIHPCWTQFFKERLVDAQEELSVEFKGAPVGSLRWSAELLNRKAGDRLALEKEFVDFEMDTQMEMASETIVRVSIKPATQTIRSVSVKTRSTTFPSILLERLKFDMAVQAESLVGLPVEFARSHEKEINDLFYNYLSENSQARKFGLKIDIKPQYSRRTVLSVKAESAKYSGFLRGKVSLGKENRNPDIEGHLGLFVRKGPEIFTELNFLPGPIEFQMNFGVGRRIGPHFYAAAGRNFIDGLNRVWLNYYLSEDIIVSWKKNVVDIDNEKNEGIVTFKAHDFFSFDLATDFRTDVWLRFVANL